MPFWPTSQVVIARSHLQILHAHHPFLLGDLAWVWSRWLNIPLVYTFHTQYEQYSHYVPLPQRPIKALTRWAVRQFARRCDLILAPSASIRDLLVEYGIANWTETLPNAIDLARFHEAPTGLRRQLGWPEEAQIGLYAGRIGKEKNLDFLLQAFAPLAHSHPDAYCALVGDGPELPHLKELAQRLEIHDQVLFTGQVTYADMPRYYAAADFFCISSTTEVKPLVVLEALASSLPVLAVSACGTQDTLRHGHDGLLTPHDVDAFRSGWEQLLQPQPRAEMAIQARRTASGYSIETYTHKLVELYREAQARRPYRKV